MLLDSRAFRDTLGCFATGICVVTCVDSTGSPHGVTINSFSSVSLDPPLVLFSIDRAASTFAHFMAARHFAVNVLAEDQAALSRNFAGTPGDRWQGIAFERWDTGCPVLQGCLAALECDVHTRHEAGDHVILLGRVRKLGAIKEGRPLLYFRGRYGAIGGAS